MGQDNDGLQTIKDFIRWGCSRFGDEGLFFGHGTDNALDEAAVLVLHALNLPANLPDTYLDCRLTAAECKVVRDLLERRIRLRVPAAYLTHEARFAGLDFYIDENVLVPRSPIAELIESDFEPWLGGREPERILDLCTGSGCIAIGCAYRFPEAYVDATDISDAALNVAGINVERHRLEDRVRLIHSDVYDQLGERTYDIILSNPPYVGAVEMDSLPEEYLQEPAIGLTAGEDGLSVVRSILRGGSRHLSRDGIMIVEVGSSAEALMDAYPEVPFLWLDFERGGDGVFLLTASQLREFRPVIEEVTE